MSTEPPELTEEELRRLREEEGECVLLPDGSVAPPGLSLEESLRLQREAREGR